MRVLVTGHRGFIGQNMVKALWAADHQVTTYEWGDGDVKLDKVDWVVHLGAISSTTGPIDKVMIQNYEFTILLLNECERRGINIQYASSASVYGNGPTFRESDEAKPQSYYAWSKYLIDRYALSKEWKNQVQGFRYFNVYGPHEDHKEQPSPHTMFRRQAKATGVIKIFEGSDKAKRDFVPVKIVTLLHQRFFEIPENGVWNVGTGTATSFTEVAKQIAAETDATIQEIPMPESLRNNYQWFTQADLTKVKETNLKWP